jgi:hypothetical protein
LFTKSPSKPKLEKLYQSTFAFKDIFAQNDSFEAFNALVEKQSWN